MKKLKEKLEYAGAKTLVHTLNLLPTKTATVIGKSLGDIWFFVDKKRKNIAIENLKNAFKDEKSDTEINQIARGSFQNLCITVIEMCRSYAKSGDWVEKTVQYDGYENVLEAQKKGKGLLFLTAHLGNWELSALRFGKDSPMNFIARKLDNALLENEAARIRTMYGNKVIHKKGAIKIVLKRLKEKETVGILIDQNTIRQEGVFVDFFGRPACTTPVLATLALKTGAPVIPAFNIREGAGKHRLVFCKEVDLKKSDDKTKDIVYNTALFTGIIESYIRKYPDQWLWMHRRWKTQPEIKE